MFSKKVFFLFFIILSISKGYSQNYDFGEVSKEEVKQSLYTHDSTAPAVILHRGRESYFEYDTADGWVIITEMHERIKILTKEGLDYGTKKISAYRKGRYDEDVRRIEGKTYNFKNGKIQEEKLRKESIFEREVNENWTEVSLAMPNIQVGSVVEWKYTLISPYKKIDDLEIQENIPLAHYSAKIRTPQFFHFKRIRKGYFKIEPNEYLKKRSMPISWAKRNSYGGQTQANNSGVMHMTELISEYEMNDIPALKEEPFVNNTENYRYKVVYELASIKYPNEQEKKFATTWEDVAKAIFKSERFGGQLEKTRFLKDDAEKIKNSSPSNRERIYNAYNLIKHHLNWNGKSRKYTEQDLSKVYKEGSGNSAEINLILIALLREVGLKANPILISTRDNGLPLFPTIEGYNYVIAGVELNDELTLLDATEKMTVPNLLPRRVYNWVGRLVKENGASQEVELYSKNIAQESTLIQAELDESGGIIGNLKRRFSALEALEYRQQNSGKTADERATLIADKHNLEDVYDLTIENLDSLNEPILESFKFEIGTGVDQIGNKQYLTPLLFTRLSANPFKLDDRQFPVDFTNPFSINKTISIIIPKGYTIESIPEPLNIKMPDDLGSFIYNVNVSGEGNILTATVRFAVNKSLIPIDMYPSLKEFYNQRVNKEMEKIVLVKTAP